MAAIFAHKQPDEDEVIKGSKLGYLYNHEFEDGRFFQVVFEDESEIVIKVATRTMLKIVYIKNKDDIEGLEIIKLVDGTEKQRVKLNKFNLQQLRSFLKFISDLDLKGITDRRIKLETDLGLDDETIRRIKTLLSGEDGGLIIKQLIDEGIVTNEDIVNTGYRKKEIAVFQKLLEEPNFWVEYRIAEGITDNKEEKVWQYYFKKNSWIFGYGLDYRYKGILQDEFFASGTDADGSNTVITDFLLADKRFTTFVEIKKPSTSLFKAGINRSKSWKLSNELIESVSQILEQKASGQIKIENEELFTEDGVLITQKAFDSKVILLIGNLDIEEKRASNQREWAYKLRTFELYRRDSRNIEIITYDELYERAKYIIEADNLTPTNSSNIASEEQDVEDLPW